MAHHVEPMDVDSSICDFDNKENSLHHPNVLAKGPCTEKGYEELEVSELNMKLRYSITPTSSPMSKSCTANCLDDKQLEAGDHNQTNAENANLTRSMNSTITSSDSVKKVLPLQSLPTDQFIDGNRNVLRPLDCTVTHEKDVTITVSGSNNFDENLSIPSSSSSLAHTPEATTPTKEFNKQDGGSPIMRGLKSVLSMFRPSQSPITTFTDDNNALKPEAISPPVINSANTSDSTPSTMLVSTPLAAQKTAISKRDTSNRDSIVFKDDLENELEWKDESTIIFSTEKIPLHKLFMTQNKPVVSNSLSNILNEVKEINAEEKLDSTVEYMDISYNDSVVKDKTITQIDESYNNNDITNVTESDSEFLDCETTFSKCANKNDVFLDNKQDENDKGEDVEDHIEVLNRTVTNESLNGIIISETHDSSPTSTESVKALVNIENKVTSLEKGSGNSVEEEIANNNPTINTCAPPLSQSQLEAEFSLTVKYTNHVSPSCNKELVIGNETNSNADKNDNVVQNIDTVKINVGNDKLSENTVATSLSQISLIADPRVLLFNIPDEISVPVHALQHTEDFNTTPADVPLPDDEDLEKIEYKNEKDEKVPIDNYETLNVMEQRPIADTLYSTLPETVSNFDKVEKELDEQHDIVTELVQLEQEAAKENKVIEENIYTINNTTETSSELGQLIDDALNRNVVNDVASIHKAEVIPALNTEKFETTYKISSVLVSDENVDLQHENFTQKDIKKMPLSKSEIENHCYVIQNETNETKSCLTEGTTVEIIHQKVETVLNEQTNSHYIKLEDVKQILVEEHNVPELQSTIVENIDVFTVFTNGSEKPCNAANNEEITEADKNVHQYLTNSDLREHIDNKTPISEKEKKLEEREIHKDNFISTDSLQKIEEINDNVADIVSGKRNKILTDSIKILNSIAREETSAEKQIETYTEKNVNSFESKIVTHLEEEIVASKDNSPFLAVSADDLEERPKPQSQEYENLENVDKNTNKTGVDVSPPLSPKILSKGYNLNFDEIEDPFATTTKIRLSPSHSLNESVETIEQNNVNPKTDFIKNRRKSQPARKKYADSKKMNSTFSGTTNISIDNRQSKELKSVSESSLKAKEVSTKNNVSVVKPESQNYENNKALDKVSEQLVQVPEICSYSKTTSSSEQSSLFEGRASKNVFNLPELDEANFNPFMTKSKVRQSPVPFQKSDDSFETNIILKTSPVLNDNSDKTMCEKAGTKDYDEIKQQANLSLESKFPLQEEHNLLNEGNNSTGSSKTTDEKNNTAREVNTEDEDTIEGPFLEAEDLNNDVKISDFGGGNLEVMQFSELPTQSCKNEDAGEMFIDAEAFEFLLNQNKANEVADSGKESLFLKFDPLYAKRMSSDGVVAALSRVQKKQSTPQKNAEFPQNDIIFDKSPIAGPSTMNITIETDAHNTTEESIEDLNITVTKPMMVVNPAVNPVPAPRNKNMTPVRSNRHSLTFTSPAIAVIDRLLSMSANNSLIGHDVTVTEVRGHNEADLALTQLRELLADKEISVYNLKSESKQLKERLLTLETQMKSLENISEERLKKINDLSEKLTEKTKMNKSMASVVEEYERTIASLIAETEQDRKRHAEERLQLINERDEQTRHLASMEVSFSDLHSKYEKSKQVIFGFKTNEDSLKKNIKDFEDNLAKMQTNYELLKQHATSKLNHANEELQKMNRAHETEVLKLNAMIKRQELHITSLEETLLQKTKANEELTAICDELINRVG